MKYDFKVACQNGVLLRDEKFMEAMHRIGTAVANLISESPERLMKYDAYSKQDNIANIASVHAEGMMFYGDIASPTPEVLDPYAVSQMMRLLLKESGLGCAIQSGAVCLSELADIGIKEGVLTKHSVDVLGRMGAGNLAAVAALNIK